MGIKNRGVKPDSTPHENQLLRNPKNSYTFKSIYQIFNKICILITFGSTWLCTEELLVISVKESATEDESQECSLSLC